tara:strand:- start:337 stop:606 length:270 start_codon:yes stop_codon:yes gene_type:complete
MSDDINGHLVRDTNVARARRLIDAALALPAVGVVLILIPVLWPGSEHVDPNLTTSTSTALIYLFTVWFSVILFAAVLAFLIKNFGVGRG